MVFIAAIWFFVILFLFVANLCYINQLERRFEIAESKIAMFPQLLICDEASLSLNNISDN